MYKHIFGLQACSETIGAAVVQGTAQKYNPAQSGKGEQLEDAFLHGSLVGTRATRHTYTQHTKT